MHMIQTGQDMVLSDHLWLAHRVFQIDASHTENTLISLISRQTQVGDSVFILLGRPLLYVLRITGGNRHALSEKRISRYDIL